MKRFPYTTLLTTAFLATVVASFGQSRSQVVETRNEFQIAGDFDGDGLLDWMIVDRESGQFRAGWQEDPETLKWFPVRSTAMTEITGAGAGWIHDLNRDSVLLAAPAANRVHILQPRPGEPVVPQPLFPEFIGPDQVVALDIGGTGNTTLDDVFISSRWNSPSSTGRVEWHRNDGSGFNVMDGETAGNAQFRHTRRAQLRKGDPYAVTTLLRNNETASLFGLDLRTGNLEVAFQMESLNPDSALTVGLFDNLENAHVLIYQPGSSTATAWLLEPVTSTTYQPKELFNIEFPSGIGLLSLVFHPDGNRLFFLSDDGRQAIVYRFNGEGDPEELQQFGAAIGDELTGFMPMGDGHLMLLTGLNGLSTGFETWLESGGTYQKGIAGKLPELDPEAGRATILEFRDEPFVSDQPGLTRSLAVSDWSTAIGLSGSPLQLSATLEQFAGPSSGLDDPDAQSLGEAHPNTSFGLPNQYRPDISLFQLFQSRGDEVVDVAVDPEGGHYPTAIQLTFTKDDPSAGVRYRFTSDSVWQTYGGTPVTLMTNATLQFYGTSSAGNSPIHSETYTFADGPDDLDSDGDGVPDYVELAKGLDPVESGNDGDGDGFFDRDELVAGTDPNNAGDTPPASHPRLEDLNEFDLLAVLKPWDGSQNVRTTSEPGTAIRVFDAPGSLLAARTNENLGLVGISDPVARVEVPVIGEEPWFTTATDPHFDIDTVSADIRRGRELIAIQEMPEFPDLPEAGYSFGYGNLATEANNWVNALQSAYAARDRQELVLNIDEQDVLAALLLERKLADIFLQRGNDWPTNFTLFPHRPADVSRRAPTLTELQLLERRSESGDPAYRLTTLLEHFNSTIESGAGSDLNLLRTLAREIYDVSSQLSNDNPGTYPPPVDALRSFIGTGSLNASYTAQVSLSGAQISSAWNAVQSVISGAPSRPYETQLLAIRADTFSGACTLVDTVDVSPATRALFHSPGVPYQSLEAFQLLPGTRLQVSGYTDLSSVDCGVPGIEVESLSVQLLPEATQFDTDGNLLLDSWEEVFFGGPANPFDDDDGDLYSNLQEMFEGTDPNDVLGEPGVTIASLAPPVLNVDVLPGGDVRLTWEWPAAYISQIQIQLLSQPTLEAPFTATPLAPMHLGGDQFEVIVAAPGAASYFFQFSLALTD